MRKHCDFTLGDRSWHANTWIVIMLLTSVLPLSADQNFISTEYIYITHNWSTTTYLQGPVASARNSNRSLPYYNPI